MKVEYLKSKIVLDISDLSEFEKSVVMEEVKMLEETINKFKKWREGNLSVI